jgi:hypothetical protein
MIKKLMLRTWAGPLPAWTPQFLHHVERLKPFGWHFKILHYPDEESLLSFRLAASRQLGGIHVNPRPGSRKICEFDPALAWIFPEVVAGYHFWGHFNLDCVYGRLEKWLPDEMLERLEIFGNDPGAICGPLTVYRNISAINRLFTSVDEWADIFSSDEFHGFDEGRFSEEVHKAARFHDLRFVSANWHSHDKMPCHVPPSLQIDAEGRLIECGRHEIMMFHFNETRRWPIHEQS